MRTAPLVALFSLSLTACVIGEIEGPPARERRRDAGPASNTLPGDDLPAPPPEDDPDEPDAASPDADPVDTGGGAPPPPVDSGGAPPPPSDTGGAPPPPVDAGPSTDAAPDPVVEYPSGPYGIGVGYVFPNVTVKGYRDGSGAWTTITMKDYYDPTGARGIKGILVVASAAWCSPCREEAKALVGMYPGYKARGARFFSTLIENQSGGYPTQSTVDGWVSYAGVNYDVAADPSKTTIPKGSSVPFNAVVDPRTMKVTKTWSGASPGSSIPALDSVIAKNGG